VADYKSGSVYAEWHRDVRYPYVRMLNQMIDELNSIPRWSEVILDSDIETLISLCEAFGINHSNYDLTDPKTFKIVKGKIMKEIKNIIEEKLKPEDPILKQMENLRLMEDELRNLMQEEEDKYAEI